MVLIKLYKRKFGVSMKKKVLVGIIIGIILIGVILFVVPLMGNKNLGDGFIGYEWEEGSEIINFDEDGSFAYYDNSGSPVGDYDLCFGYYYSQKSGKIGLFCFNPFLSLFTNMRVIEYNDRVLRLKINGKTKNFSKIQFYDEDFVGFWSREVNGYTEELFIWDDGSIAYTKSKEISLDEFEANADFYGNESIGYYDDFEKGTVDVHFAAESPFGDYYVYNKESNSLLVYDKQTDEEIIIKIIFSDKDNLKVEINNEIREFKSNN